MQLANLFIKRLKKYLPTSKDAIYIDMGSCEFIKYHFVNYKRRPIRFLIRFIFDLFYVKNYNYNLLQQDDMSQVLLINTSDYIFKDNIQPLITKLNSKGIGSIQLSRSFKTRSLNISVILDIIKIIKNNDKIATGDLIPFLYYKLISIRDINNIIKSLDLLHFKKLKFLISADPCDLFSRVAISYFKNKQVQSLILQTGPTDFDALEWKMLNCDLLCCWPEFSYFFNKSKVNCKVFFPPRFYYTLENKNYSREFDIFIFLTWVDNSKFGLEIKKSMIESINFIAKEFKGRIGLKFHPAQKLNISKIPTKFEIVDIDSNAQEIIAKSQKVLCFGSTIIFDCIYQKVPVGIINFAGQIPDKSVFMKQDNNVIDIKNTADLKTFINHYKYVPTSNKKNDIVCKETLVENYIYDRIVN
jgi:hypothetical protein